MKVESGLQSAPVCCHIGHHFVKKIIKWLALVSDFSLMFTAPKLDLKLFKVTIKSNLNENY